MLQHADRSNGSVYSILFPLAGRDRAQPTVLHTANTQRQRPIIDKYDTGAREGEEGESTTASVAIVSIGKWNPASSSGRLLPDPKPHTSICRLRDPELNAGQLPKPDEDTG